MPTLQALASALLVNKTVTKVDLEKNKIGDEGLKARAPQRGPRLGGCGMVGLRGEESELLAEPLWGGASVVPADSDSVVPADSVSVVPAPFSVVRSTTTTTTTTPATTTTTTTTTTATTTTTTTTTTSTLAS